MSETLKVPKKKPTNSTDTQIWDHYQESKFRLTWAELNPHTQGKASVKENTTRRLTIQSRGARKRKADTKIKEDT